MHLFNLHLCVTLKKIQFEEQSFHAEEHLELFEGDKIKCTSKRNTRFRILKWEILKLVFIRLFRKSRIKKKEKKK